MASLLRGLWPMAEAGAAELLQAAREEVLALHRQLLHGCGRAACTRPHCAANPNVGPCAANAALARALAVTAQGTAVRCPPPPPLLHLADVQRMAAQGAAGLQAAVHACFSSPAALGQSFLLEGAAGLPQPHGSGLDAVAAASAYALLVGHEEDSVRNALLYASQAAASALRAGACGEGALEGLRALLLLLLNPLLLDPAWQRPVLAPLLAAAWAWQEGGRLTLATWAVRLQGGGARQVLRALQAFVALRIVAAAAPTAAGDAELGMACGLLQALAQASAAEARPPLAAQEFYNDVLNEWLNARGHVRRLLAAYLAWRRGGEAFAVCAAPAVLHPQTKSKLLRWASLEEQGRTQEAALQRMLATGEGAPYFLLVVERGHLLETTLARVEQALARGGHELKQELRVRFEGEEGVDAGGVQKEFFQLLVRRLFDPRFGMFVLDAASNSFWFSHASEDMAEFELVGTLLGLAVYNGVVLDLRLPPAAYKKLMQAPLSWEDLRDTHPAVHAGLARLLELDAAAVPDLDLCFQVAADYYGEARLHDLLPGGADVPVTADNRRRFVDLYAAWLLEGSVARQSAAFVRGFRHVCGELFFELFRAEELELLVCGDPVLDFHELQRAAAYDNGYSAEHPVIQRFWRVLHSMTAEEQRKFLFFTTGSDRAPIGGLGELKFVVVRHGEDSEQLPQSHTCFNALLLPEYATDERMRDRLLVAITNSEGFGML